jgi:hypothetical protein
MVDPAVPPVSSEEDEAVRLQKIEDDKVRPLKRRLPAHELEQRLIEHGWVRIRGKVRQCKATQAIARDLADTVETGWTERELAEYVGASQKWVNFQTRFGRFLNLSTIVLNEGKSDRPKLSTIVLKLTEGRFRALFERTDPAEADGNPVGPARC